MALKKSLKTVVSIILAVALCIGNCVSAFAASSNKENYIKEVYLSYGKTAKEAKNYLTDNGYEVVDYNLNEGADDTISDKRAVYLGYKTTSNAEEAITDLKLMNMKGGYSVQDYQMILSEQKDNIKAFFDDFKVAVKEFRANYNAGQQRAIAAYELLNMLYDDDTEQNLGDLLLKKVKEEYTDEEYNALPDSEKAKVADMTTILMQGNSLAILSMERIIAMGTDESDTPWANRYQEAKTYDEMVEDLMDSLNLTVSEAQKKLDTEYSADAKKVASSFEAYKEYLAIYTNAEISFENTNEEIEAYAAANEDFDMSKWLAAGTQYETVKALTNDDVSLYDLITSDEYDVTNEDSTMLYPLIASLSEGQRACLDFLPMYQLVSIGINDENTFKAAMEEIDIDSVDGWQNISIYDGVDRSIFNGDVALTGEAYRLQNSTGKNPVTDVTDYISKTSYVLYATFAVSLVATSLCWKLSSSYAQIYEDMSAVNNRLTQLNSLIEKAKETGDIGKVTELSDQWKDVSKEYDMVAMSKSESLSNFFRYAGIAMTCVTIVIMAASLVSTYLDLKEYYNAEFTPIPSVMVNQGVNENDERVYTYYSAVKCNRAAQGMESDKTKLLGDFGDINGDVGRQWVALYATKDAAAGDPITKDFIVQYGNSDIPNDSTPLSIFCESTAQNLTNKKAGYTYADSKEGIYLFYGTDSNVFAGSVFSSGKYVLVGGVSAIVAAAIAFYIGKYVGAKNSKKSKKETAAV